MIYNKELIEEVNAYYSLLRSNANTLSQVNLAIANNDENYKKAVKELGGYSYEIAKANYDGDNITAQKLIEEQKQKLKNLETALNNIGLTQKDLEPKYTCKICNDTGNTPLGTKCKCFYRYVNDFSLKNLGIEKRKLPTFNEDTLSKTNETLTKNYNLYRDYINKFDTTRIHTHLFLGKTGTGKTFLAGCIASEILKLGKTVLFLSSFELNKIFIKYHTANIEEKQIYLDILNDADLLVIDELGVEQIFNNVTLEYLYVVINERLINNKQTIITTNLTLNELQDRYHERIYSRIKTNNSVAIEFKGDNLR